MSMDMVNVLAAIGNINFKDMANVLMAIGDISLNQGQYEKSLQMYGRAQDILVSKDSMRSVYR
jgi:hypothetical protein